MLSGKLPLPKANTGENFAELKQRFLDDVVATVSMEEIPPELILNWDQNIFTASLSLMLKVNVNF